MELGEDEYKIGLVFNLLFVKKNYKTISSYKNE